VVNGIRLHYVEAGQGPLVVLLHGFPEFWYGWRFQIPALAAAGFRVVAPDLRGYNLSEKPEEVSAYRIARVADDVAGLVRHVAGERDRARATIVGHDWGGIAAISVATRHEALTERIVVLNAPHPAAFAREIRNPAQMARSAYALFFQIPAIAEAALRADDFRALREILERDPLRPEAFTDADIREYVEAWEQPGALTAMLNYYRAAARHRLTSRSPETRPLGVPSMVIWGERDRFLRTELLDGLDRWMPGVRIARIPEASHWVQHDAPDRVNELLIAFCREAATSRR
jgi:epoxide hydrolase 4